MSKYSLYNMARFAPNAGAPQFSQQDNMIARQAVIQRSIEMKQSIAQGTVTTGAGSVLNIPVRNVGLIKKFTVEITATVRRSAAETQTMQPWGPANFLSQIVFTDLANNTRIQTTGWHLYALSCVKRRFFGGAGAAFGAAYTNDSPIDMGSNFTVISAPQSFGAGDQTIRMFYEVPVAYTDWDLRGAIYANVVNATMNLQLTVNPSFFVASTADGTLAGYKSSGTDLGTIPTFTYKVYQHYLDQLPMTRNGPILPLFDLATAYLLNNTMQAGLANAQDNAIPYSNFRDFLSTFLIYDNIGLNAGTDINYLALQSANYTNIWNVDPFMASLETRNLVQDDFPAGTYYFDYRNKPVSTIQYGNMQLIVNPSNVAGAASQFLLGYEALAIINQVTQAGSLSST